MFYLKLNLPFVCFLLLLARWLIVREVGELFSFSCLKRKSGFILTQRSLFRMNFFQITMLFSPAFFPGLWWLPSRRGGIGCLQSVNQLFKWVTKEKRSIPNSGMREVHVELYITKWRGVSFFYRALKNLQWISKAETRFTFFNLKLNWK